MKVLKRVLFRMCAGGSHWRNANLFPAAPRPLRGGVGAMTHGVIAGEGAEYTASLVCSPRVPSVSFSNAYSVMATIVHTHTRVSARAHTHPN